MQEGIGQGQQPRPPDQEAETRVRAGVALAEGGDLEGAAASLRACVALWPANLSALGQLGTVEQRLGHYAQAESLFRRALDIAPEHGSSLQCLANVLVLQDRYRSATPIYEKLLDQGGAPLACRTALGRCYLQEGRWHEAAVLCDEILTEAPWHAGVISMRQVARHESGECPLDATGLRDLFAIVFPDSAPGFASMESLNHALAGTMAARTDLVENPYDKTTRGGSQTGDLAADPAPCIQTLAALIRQSVEAFLASRAETDESGYWNRPVTGLGLTLWATVLGAGGHQESHIHQAAWLSGVYYARLPRSIRPEDPGRGGWIEFGQPPPRYPCRKDYPLESVCPREGMLVLFPSYLFHRTVPLPDTGTRLSFAFDVVVPRTGVT